ncbi:galactosyldiacylglycerol synthase [Xylophilus rhododendri]|uniref:Galactosyldiacylglycerol synthase n=1 Tax=Xylophilus rhododendri TaxID=2697032 RepID=A0A857JBB5_9BURK|nr:glycosyltransferase [Xylophilus rhododendri]QHJ00039.1 galactosyldiacylglycerol synthase [Xylophilus rhododendri]
MRRKLELIYFDAGGGHRAAAHALQEVIRQQQRPWDLELVNLFEVLDPQGMFRKLTGAAPEAYYNRRLARGWTVGLAQELRVLQGLIRLFHTSLVTRLQRHWDTHRPDLVVSLIPNFNRALFEAAQSRLPGVPYVTVLTDMADHPPHFWIEPGQRQHIVCGTARALAQARAAGYEDEQLSLTSGMLLRPSFYAPRLADRSAAMLALGLDPAQPTGIVMFGGQGSMQMLRIARELGDRQLILMCGHNQALAERLRAQPSEAPHAVVGFTQDVARHLQLADYFIGKPGPGSLSEALQQGLPVITLSGAAIMPQERYNVVWLTQAGFGLALPSWREVARGVAEMVDHLPVFQARVRRYDNRAIFEVPEIFAALMAHARSPAGPAERWLDAALVA